jgi:hypothetical protein
MVSVSPVFVIMMICMMWMFMSHSMCVIIMRKDVSMFVQIGPSSLVIVPIISDSSAITAVSCIVAAVEFPLSAASLACVMFDVNSSTAIVWLLLLLLCACTESNPQIFSIEAAENTSAGIIIVIDINL